MKTEDCYKCGKEVEVEDEYEPQGCCDGRECGCQGSIINPVFCAKCMETLYPGENS